MNNVKKHLEQMWARFAEYVTTRLSITSGRRTNNATPAEISPERRKRAPYLFLFIGESGSGKSTAIRNIFKAGCDQSGVQSTSRSSSSTTAASTNSKNFQRWTHDPEDFHETLDIIEVPGLLQDTTEHDATVVSALQSFLKSDSPVRLPTIVFITARLDDNRFEGEQSTFTRTLRCIFQIRSVLTDGRCSNVILLLTHGDRPEVKDDLRNRVDRYQAAFSAIFKTQVTTKIVDNKAYTTVNLKSLLERQSSSKFTLVYKLVNSKLLAEVGSNTNPPQYAQSTFPPLKLLPPIPSNMHSVRELMSRIMGDVVHIEDEADINEQFIPIEIQRESSISAFSEHCGVVHNCVHPRCPILLVNGKYYEVEDCMIGDRVVGLDSTVGVITRICQFDTTVKSLEEHAGRQIAYHKCLDSSECDTKKIQHLCMIFIKRNFLRKKSVKKSTRKRREQIGEFLYNAGESPFQSRVYNSKAHRKACEAINSERNKLAYYIEVDSGSGTFIADGFVRASETVCGSQSTKENAS